MRETRLRIVNPLGLHARAAGKLVKLARGFASTVTLSHNGTTADAKSILSLLALAAPNGTWIDVVVDGPDENRAMDQVEQLFVDGFGEI